MLYNGLAEVVEPNHYILSKKISSNVKFNV